MYKVSFGGRPYCALDPARLPAALSILPRHTLKKKLMIVYSALFAGFNAALQMAGVNVDDDEVLVGNGLSIRELREIVGHTLKTEIAPLLLLWCRDAARQRLYAWATDEKGRRWFLKVGTGYRNRDLFSTEVWGYATVSGVSSDECRDVHFLEPLPDLYILVTPWICGSVRPRNWEDVVGLLALARRKSYRAVVFCGLNGFSWFHGNVLSERTELNIRVTSMLRGQELLVCFAHGDLGSENVITTYDNVMHLIDFERSCKDAPFYADQFSILLDGRFGRKLDDVISEMLGLATREEIVFAMAFLAENEFPPALEVLKRLVGGKT